MNIGTVRSLFAIFSGEPDPEPHMPFIDLAVSETKSMLREGADEDDPRLDFLCAALADLYYQRAALSRVCGLPYYTGRLPRAADTGALTAPAESLVREHMNICRDLITSGDFDFFATD